MVKWIAIVFLLGCYGSGPSTDDGGEAATCSLASLTCREADGGRYCLDPNCFWPCENPNGPAGECLADGWEGTWYFDESVILTCDGGIPACRR